MNRDFAATGLILATEPTFSIVRRPGRVLVASITQPLSTRYKLHLQSTGLGLRLKGTREEEGKKRLEKIDRMRRAYYETIVEAQSQLDSLEASLQFYWKSKRLAVENRKAETSKARADSK